MSPNDALTFRQVLTNVQIGRNKKYELFTIKNDENPPQAKRT